MNNTATSQLLSRHQQQPIDLISKLQGTGRLSRYHKRGIRISQEKKSPSNLATESPHVQGGTPTSERKAWDEVLRDPSSTYDSLPGSLRQRPIPLLHEVSPNTPQPNRSSSTPTPPPMPDSHGATVPSGHPGPPSQPPCPISTLGLARAAGTQARMARRMLHRGDSPAALH